ncbi:hypothetical protein L211DRAFT_841122 [Terfezia boudieri ATCC MYA-4762]|uniref:Uncharacterized protein n=1 Tax=Terfezia boudieri ATCC MYA-4762 TaxID=1051890 RepID=A0A3N4LHL5_9PEZI|nr:hypothetical protein L211DRAFT_841122 [Terfezia boudieri ATCC MYA-4762]
MGGSYRIASKATMTESKGLHPIYFANRLYVSNLLDRFSHFLPILALRKLGVEQR